MALASVMRSYRVHEKNWYYLNFPRVIAHRWAVINRDGGALSSSRGERKNQRTLLSKKKAGFFHHEREKLSLLLYAGGGILLSAWPRSDEPAISILS